MNDRYIAYYGNKKKEINLILKYLPFSHTFIDVFGGSGVVGISYKNPALASTPLYSFLAIGLCGGFTTFSTFAFENQTFLKNGQILEFTFYTLSSIIIGILAISLGLHTAKAI